jgi:glycosyltransferase involved in cell wall biosynthesis
VPAVTVTVVIPVYNGESYLLEALESIANQTFRALELIVIDDGSTDGTQRILADFASRENRLRMHRQRHAGVVSAFNVAASMAEGEYLAWLGADDVAFPQRLENQVRFMDAHSHVAAVGTALLATDANLRPILPIRYPTSSGHIRKALRTGNVLAAPAAMIRNSAFRSVGGCRMAFNQGAEDYDLWIRLSERYGLANLDEAFVYYRVHQGQVTRQQSEQVMVATIGAQVSAAARRSGRPDPFDTSEHITYEMLVAAGCSRQAVDSALVDAAAGYATFLALLGAEREALVFLDWANARTSGTRLHRRARARALIARGLVNWKSRRRYRALVRGISGGIQDPALACQLLVRGLHARVFAGGSESAFRRRPDRVYRPQERLGQEQRE